MTIPQEIKDKMNEAFLKIGEAHTLLAKTKLDSKEYQPISTLLATGKVLLFNGYNDIEKEFQEKDKEIEELKGIVEKYTTLYYELNSRL